MDWYALVKVAHVMAAVLWLGGGLVMVLLGMAAARRQDDARFVEVGRQVAWLGERVFVPAAVATLVFGLLATWMGNLWAEVWVILGLIGIGVTMTLGIAVLTPAAKKIEAGYIANGVTPSLVEMCRELLRHAKFDMVMLYTVVAVMVLKPAAEDWIELTVMALVVLAAAVTFLLPMRNGRSPEAA